MWLRQLAPLPPNPNPPAYFVISLCIAALPCLYCLHRSPRSRYTHLSWALFEKEEGKVEEARRLFKAGSELNPRDAAILQVGGLSAVGCGQCAAGTPSPAGWLVCAKCWVAAARALNRWRWLPPTCPANVHASACLPACLHRLPLSVAGLGNP